MKTDRCPQCPASVEAPGILCPSCAIELAYRVMAAYPEPATRTCKVCRAPFSFLEARVIRSAKDHKAGDPETPNLCWVCARLHLSAKLPESTDPPPIFFQV